MAWNKGINFGLFAGFDMRWVLIALALSISVGVIYWVHRDGKTKWTFVAAGMLVGGALGNVLDRVIYGAVADFLNFSCCGLNNPYAFNIADVAVFAGAAALVFTSSESSDTNTRTKKKN
jgi:signal peptidase II